MTEEKIYVLKNGDELVLLSRILIDNIKYLLLIDNKTYETVLATEENKALVYLDKNIKKYENIMYELIEKLKREYEVTT